MTARRTIGNRIAPPRFIVFFALLFVGIGVGLAFVERAQAIMIAFDVAATIFLLSCLPLLRHHADAMRQAARENDANRVQLLIVSLAVSLVILVTIAGELVGRSGPPTFADKLLIVVTLGLAWVGANTVYTLHYAHLYYLNDAGRDRGGLEFPGGREEPDYLDFVYFAFTLGAALQTSDVMVTSAAIRRIVTLHCLEAFIFNTGVLALAISIVTG